MKRIRTILVDDERLARRGLELRLASAPDIEIVAECANGFEAVKAAGQHKPDLVFLDVQMPKLDGFEVLELIGSDVAVIFVTAYDTYAMRAFEVHAVDYLLKPFSQERLDHALERAAGHAGVKAPAELAAAARGCAAERPDLLPGAGYARRAEPAHRCVGRRLRGRPG